MAEAYYEPTPATDGATMNPVPGAVFEVFEIADTSFSTPLSLRVGSGNPTTSVTASDTLATLPGVYVTSPNFEHIWKSGTFEWRRDSITGAKLAIEAAKQAASDSAASAAASAALVDAPAGEAVRVAIAPGGAANPELDSQISGAVVPYSHTDSSGLVTQMIAQANPAVNVLDAPTLSIFGPGGADPIASGVDYPFDLSSGVTAIGCYPVSIVALSTNYTQNQVNGQSGSGAKPWAIEFDTASQNVSMIFRAAGSSVRFHVYVDGRPATRNPQAFTNNIAANSKSYLKLTFGSAKLRRVRIYMNAADYGGLRVDTGTTATPTTPAEKISAAMYGDSWFAGTTLAPWPFTPGSVLGRILGWETFECSIGGTGYVASATPFNVAARTTPLYAVTPDYVIVSGSINDNSSTGIQDAAATFYSGIGTNLPAAKIIVVGPQPVPANYATSTALLANRDAVEAAALAATNVIGFIDPMDAAWLSGTGNIDSPTGDGNRDAFVQSDALHLTKQGGYYYATRIAEEVIRVLDKNGLTW